MAVAVVETPHVGIPTIAPKALSMLSADVDLDRLAEVAVGLGVHFDRCAVHAIGVPALRGDRAGGGDGGGVARGGIRIQDPRVRAGQGREVRRILLDASLDERPATVEDETDHRDHAQKQRERTRR